MLPWQINKILITGTGYLLLPQDAAFCAVSRGSILSRASQNEIHHSAKHGKMRQIEATKSSRKVVKRDFSTTEISASRIPYAELPGQQKTGWICSSRHRCFHGYSVRKCLFEIFISSVLLISASCSLLALSSCCIRFISSTASSNPRYV